MLVGFAASFGAHGLISTCQDEAYNKFHSSNEVQTMLKIAENAIGMHE